jgi:hypothetical protein
MAIRTKKYTFIDGRGVKRVVRGVRITEKNIVDVVNYITRRGGAATGHLTIPGKNTKERPGRIRLRQLNFGENWGKRDWRVANVGDAIIVHDANKEFSQIGFDVEFERVKAADFERDFEEVK